MGWRGWDFSKTTQVRWPCFGKLEDAATGACAPRWKGDVGTRDGALDGNSHRNTPHFVLSPASIVPLLPGFWERKFGLAEGAG